jgi:hypothetical protein
MIRRALLAAVILAVAASAEVATAQPQSSTPLELWVDPDGTTYLFNTTAVPINFDGYQITSETNSLDPAGWKSIADYISGGDFATVIGALGPGGLTFGEANPSAGNLAELNLGNAGTLQGGAKFAIGKPLLRIVDPGFAANFYYKVAGNPNSIQGAINPTGPEPSTFVLAALAGIGLLAMRRCKPARSLRLL